MRNEPERVARLRRNGAAFLAGARARGLDTATSVGAAVVPVVVGNSPHASLMAQRLLERGFNVVPAIFPGVPENLARLRFFLTSGHTAEQIESVLDATAEELAIVRSQPSLIRAMGRT